MLVDVALMHWLWFCKAIDYQIFGCPEDNVKPLTKQQCSSIFALAQFDPKVTGSLVMSLGSKARPSTPVGFRSKNLLIQNDIPQYRSPFYQLDLMDLQTNFKRTFKALYTIFILENALRIESKSSRNHVIQNGKVVSSSQLYFQPRFASSAGLLFLLRFGTHR